jgi:uncharacterized protein
MTTPPKVSLTFVNLPVADLKATVAFYGALGFTFNPQFSDATSACMIINETCSAMLLSHDKFKSFSKAAIPDARHTTGVLVALALPTRADVDALVSKGLAAGGQEPTPAVDHGFMYQRTLADLDGHRWEPFFFDTTQMPTG